MGKQDYKANCNLILKKMQEAGFDVIESCETWTDSEIIYFLINYQEHYLKIKFNGDEQ